MIQVNKLLTALLVSAIATSSYAVKVEVMPTVGKAVYRVDKDSLKDDEILYGVRGTVFLNDEVGVQAAYEGSTSNEVGTAAQRAAGARTDIERVSANVVYEKDLGSRIRPYGIIGVGNESTHGLIAPAGNNGSQGFVNVGAGLKFGISKHVDLVTEAKWIRKLSNNDDDLVATVGLGINTGSSTKPACKVPSIQATSDVQNAINLAEFRKISNKNAVQQVAKKEVVETVATMSPAVVEPVVVAEDNIPADAIVLDEDATVSDTSVETSFVEQPTAIEESASEDGYYVQLAALFKGDGRALTNRLEQKNYHYVLHNVDRGRRTATLILVGPYQSQAEANVARKYLKRLKKDAFIYHMN